MTLTDEQWRRIRQDAYRYPALSEALACLHECLTATHRGDAYGAADSAAKAICALADETYITEEWE